MFREHSNYYEQEPFYNYRDTIHNKAKEVFSCSSKMFFKSFVSAEEHINYIIKSKPGVVLYSYKCPHCIGWHTTKKKQ